MGRLSLICGFTLGLALVFVFSAQAAVPPPPVNQLIGIYDTRLVAPSESDCRVCHSSGLPDRHHLLVQTQNRECLNCHTVVVDNSCQCLVFSVTRDCLECHNYVPDSSPSTPHHITSEAQERHCSNCHGSVVQDFDDDHYIPDYDISAVTPDPVCKTWDGPVCVSGGCNVCHAANPAAVPPIVAYSDLHHETRFDCMFCHNTHGNIRDCEACHSPASLHNIQADSDNPQNAGTIIPGEENLGWGHIGNGWDCFGCHESFGFAAASMPSGFNTSPVTPQTRATIPTIYGMSANTVTAGRITELTVYGSGFINSTGGTTFSSDVVINNGPAAITPAKVSMTESRIIVNIPSSLSAGIYDLRVVKDNWKSNIAALTVVPPVIITEVNCNNKMGVMSIRGSGFNEKVPGTDKRINVQMNGVPVKIISWSDTVIKAAVRSCENSAVVTVNALMGSARSGGGKPHRPCTGKKCR